MRLALSHFISLRAAVLGLAALVAPAALRAQATTPKVFFACYVPNSGTVYRIKETDLKQECSKFTHVQFSWTDGAGAFRQTMTVSSGSVISEPSAPAGTILEQAAICPDGWVATGGGFFIAQGSEAFSVSFNGPSLTDPLRSFRVSGRKTAPELVILIAKAYCAR